MVTWTFILCLYSYITFLSFYSKLFQELSYRFESPWPPAFYIQIVYFFELNSYSIGYYRSKCFIQHFKMYAWDYTHECRLYNRIKFNVLCVTLSSDQNLKKKWKKNKSQWLLNMLPLTIYLYLLFLDYKLLTVHN